MSHTPKKKILAPSKVPKLQDHFTALFDGALQPTAGGLGQRSSVRELVVVVVVVLLPGLLALKEHSYVRLSKTAGEGEMVFQVQPDMRIRKRSHFAFSEPMLSSSMPSRDTLLTCTRRHMALSWVGALVAASRGCA